MTLGIILLTQDDCYLQKSGKLPTRPKWDKDLLVGLCKNRKVVCSENVAIKLPKSIVDNCQLDIGNQPWAADVNLGIDTFDRLPKLLLITRSLEGTGDISKRFRYRKNYTKILDLKGFEIWTKN